MVNKNANPKSLKNKKRASRILKQIFFQFPASAGLGVQNVRLGCDGFAEELSNMEDIHAVFGGQRIQL